MINSITLKSDGSTSQLKEANAITLDAPSVVTLGFGPEEVARFDKVGSDLVLLLKDGTRVQVFTLLGRCYGSFDDEVG